MNQEELKAFMDDQFKAFKEGLPKQLTEKELTDKLEEFKGTLDLDGIKKEDVEEMFETHKDAIGKDIADKLRDKEGTKESVTGVTQKDLDNIKESLTKGTKAEITVKAAAAMTTANITSGTHLTTYEVVPGIQSAPREANVVLPTLLKGSTKGRTIYWSNRVNEDGGSAWTAEAGLKPLKDWDYEEENSVAKKVTVRGNFSREILNDMTEFNQEIQRMLRLDLLEYVDEQLLTSTLSSTAPAGITTVASSYTTTNLDDQIDLPNNADAIRAAMLQLRLLNYKPNVVFVNPTEAAIMDLTKNENGNYIKIEIEGILRSLQVIETTRIDAGYFLLMDTEKWIVKILEDISVEFGYNTDDFSKNMITAICEMRLHSYYNSIDVGAFLYDQYDTVKAAIDSNVA